MDDKNEKKLNELGLVLLSYSKKSKGMVWDFTKLKQVLVKIIEYRLNHEHQSKRLSDDQRIALIFYYGLDNIDDDIKKHILEKLKISEKELKNALSQNLSHKEIGKLLGLSRPRVQFIIKRAISKLRYYSTQKDHTYKALINDSLIKAPHGHARSRK